MKTYSITTISPSGEHYTGKYEAIVVNSCDAFGPHVLLLNPERGTKVIVPLNLFDDYSHWDMPCA